MITAPSDAGIKATDTQAADIFRAPLLEAVLTDLRTRERVSVLDAGPARGRTLAFFSQGRHRLAFADAITTLAEEGYTADGTEPGALLPDLGNQPLDLVLCWDLPNYLAQKQFAAVLEPIAGASSSATLIHCIVAYSAQRIPERPGDHAILPDASVSRRVSGGERPAPKYPMADLDRFLPRYVMERSVLLRNGFQECLLRCRRPGA